MGGVAPTGGGGKRSMDAYINLVPYIDLLMTLMTFLVMTAVWTQMAALDVQNSSGGPAEQVEEEKDPPKGIFFLLTADGFTVQEEGAEGTLLPKTAAGYDWEGAKVALTALKTARVDRTQVQVKPEDGVEFEVIAQAIDLCGADGIELTGVQLQPASQ